MRVLPVALALLAAGCLADAPQPQGLPQSPLVETAASGLVFQEPVLVTERCNLTQGVLAGGCYEPTAVEAAGRLVATNGNGGDLFASDDGGDTWHPLPGVHGDLVLPPRNPGGDALVQVDPQGRLWLSALRGSSVFVARSDDGGVTWPVVRNVPMGDRVDRQWLVFGEDAVLVQVQKGRDGQMGVRTATSRDDGAGWTSAVQVGPGNITGAGTAVGGRFVLPSHDHAGRSVVLVSLSDDAGASWRQVVVHDRSGPFFPAIAASQGRLLLAWLTGPGELASSWSDDGGETWSPAARLSTPGQQVTTSPWVLGHASGFDVAYFVLHEGSVRLEVLRLTEEGASRGTAATFTEAYPGEERPANTDHAYLAHDADGRVLAAYVDGDGRLRLVREAS